MAKEEELNLYHQWKKTGQKGTFQDLYKSMKNLLHDAAKKASYGSNLPESAHKAWAAQNFFDALKTYNPKSGASLQTHIYGSVHQKAKRLNYMYQNLGYIPEPRAMQIGLYQSEYENLKESLGREPSTAELADRLNWNMNEVSNIQREVQKELGITGLEEQITFETPEEEEILNYIYYELSGEEKTVYEYVFGKYGKPRMVKPNGKIDFEGIAFKVGYSPSKVRSVFGRIRTKLKKALER